MTRIARFLILLLAVPSATVAAFEKEEERELKSAPAYVERGLERAKGKQLDKAIADYTAAIRLDPAFAASHVLRGLAWHEKQAYDKALRDFTEGIRLDPSNAWTYVNRGITWEAKGELDKAIQDYTEGIRLEPEDATPYLMRGLAWKTMGKFDKAVGDFTEVIRLDPQAVCYANRGHSWKSLRRYGKALVDYQEAVRLDPENSIYRNNLAWFYATCPEAKYRDGKQALASAMKGCELTHWKKADHLDSLAAAYAESNDFENAVKWQTKSLEIASKAEKLKLQARLELYKAGKPYRE